MRRSFAWMAWARAGAAVGALALTAPALGAGREADEALARYLEARGLDSLLIDHLEALLARASADDRATLAERLATMYAQTLEKTEDPAARMAIERRARALLDTFPDAEGFDLRLTLHRANYTRAEGIAERARVGMAEAEEVGEAMRSLRALTTDLTQIGAAAHRRVEALERQEQAAGGEADSAVLRDALASARRQRSLAMYLAGWSGVYLAELAERPRGERPKDLPSIGALATESAKRFGWLLNAAQNEAPTVDRVPDSSLRLDHVARAALGMGTCASLRDDHDEATRWFDLVAAAEDTPAPVREQLFLRRLTAAARNQEWTEALRQVREKRGSEETTESASEGRTITILSPAEARLLATLTFEIEAPARAQAVQARLRAIALADLIAARELTQALALTERFGAAALAGLGDATGFIPTYIRGLQSYERAREAHRAAIGAASESAKREGAGSEDDPTDDRAVAALYEEAAGTLKVAAAAPDADRFGPARANALMLLGMSVFLASSDGASAARAAERFEAAVTHAPSAPLAADAMWMRLRALERAEAFAERAVAAKKAAAGSAESRVLAEARAKREGAAREFLAKFPSDARTVTMLIRRAAGTTGGGDDATLDALLAIDASSPMAEAARLEAARLLYRRVRGAGESERRAAVERFVGLAQPMMLRAHSAAMAGDAGAGARAKTLARQLLDAFLSGPERGADAERATPALEALLGLEASGVISLEDCAGEVVYRRLQVARAKGDAQAMRRLSAELRERFADSSDPFVVAARRAMAASALEGWRAGAKSPEAARLLVEEGSGALGAWATEDAPKAGDASDETVGLMLAVAEAAHASWEFSRAEGDRALALRLMRSVLRLRPNAESALRMSAERGAALGDASMAEESWKRLMLGAEIGAKAWFEATASYIALVFERDPAAGLALLEKHRAVYPEFGPAPWGERLRALHERATRGAAEAGSGAP